MFWLTTIIVSKPSGSPIDRHLELLLLSSSICLVFQDLSMPGRPMRCNKTTYNIAAQGRKCFVVPNTEGSKICTCFAVERQSTQIPGTATFLNKWGDATVLGGYFSGCRWNSWFLNALLYCSVDSQTA
jgi:hypothetical protein